MLTPGRSLTLHAESGRELPRVPELQPLYDWGIRPRYGEIIMIVGRSGAQKSGFGLWWTAQMGALHGIRTLYFSADMSPFTASSRVASMFTGLDTDQVVAAMAAGGAERERCVEAIRHVPIQFAFGPLNWEVVDDELEAYIELWDRYPDIVVFDNLMDFDGAEASYEVMMSVMQGVSALKQETGITPVVMHHATDKSFDAKSAPWEPASRNEIKYGMAEKGEQVWSVAITASPVFGGIYEYRIACIKQRMGPSDPTARRYPVIYAEPSLTRFHAR